MVFSQELKDRKCKMDDEASPKSGVRGPESIVPKKQNMPWYTLRYLLNLRDK